MTEHLGKVKITTCVGVRSDIIEGMKTVNKQSVLRELQYPLIDTIGMCTLFLLHVLKEDLKNEIS